MEVDVPIAPAAEPEIARPSPAHIPSPTGALSVEQRVKLQSELDVVQSNMMVFGDMLNEMKPGAAQPDEIELLQVYYLTKV